MAQFWKQPRDGRRFNDGPGEPVSPDTRTLIAREFICVAVCSFTFYFESKEEVLEYIAFYEKKTHPSSRIPMPKRVDGFFRWHSQRFYERLPMYLQEESKRRRVLNALRKAVTLVEAGKVQSRLG